MKTITVFSLIFVFVLGVYGESASDLAERLDKFSYMREKGATISDLSVVNKNVSESVVIASDLLSQTNRTVESKMSLIVLLDQLQKKESMVSRVVSGRLLEVAINSDEKPEVRRRAAQGIIVNEIDSIGLNQLMGAFLEDLRDGDAKILAPVLIEFPADHEFPERLQQDIIIGLKNAIAEYDELTDLRSFVDICRRYYSDQIETVLFSSIVRESTRPLLSKKNMGYIIDR